MEAKQSIAREHRRLHLHVTAVAVVVFVVDTARLHQSRASERGDNCANLCAGDLNRIELVAQMRNRSARLIHTHLSVAHMKNEKKNTITTLTSIVQAALARFANPVRRAGRWRLRVRVRRLRASRKKAAASCCCRQQER